MKIWCNSCESAEAVVMCCADDAALCRRCDEKIHAANKVASKHQRTSLSYCPKLPACDICQDAIGYFFCVEDRALLCSKCDVAIHTANAYVGGHQRFLITGVRVGTDPSPTLPSTVGAVDRVPSATTPSKNSATVIPKKLLPSAPPPPLPPSMAPPVAPAAVNIFSGQPCVRDDIGLPNRFQFNAGPLITGSLPNWGFDDFMSLPDFDQNFAMLDNGSSKGDTNKYGECDWSPVYPAVADEELPSEDHTLQVPEMPSPPTASGHYWPSSNFLARDQYVVDDSMFVPDITASSVPVILKASFYGSHHGERQQLMWKRRRNMWRCRQQYWLDDFHLHMDGYGVMNFLLFCGK